MERRIIKRKTVEKEKRTDRAKEKEIGREGETERG